MEKRIVSYTDFITAINGKGHKVEFENCIFEAGLSLNFPRTQVFEKEIVFKNCDFLKIEFIRCLFTKRVYFHACNITKEIAITVCEFRGPFNTTHLKANGIL